jgi:ABC-type Fe3+-hydroxamate transport system substrate-binding protein
MLKLGELTGHAAQAENTVHKLRKRLSRVRSIPRSGKAVFYEIWPDPLMTAGGPSFITELIKEAGGKNVFADIKLPAPRVSVESVIRAKPELIVVPLEERDVEGRERFWAQWPGLEKVRIVAIDPDILHRPGPRLLDGLEALQQAFAEEESR